MMTKSPLRALALASLLAAVGVGAGACASSTGARAQAGAPAPDFQARFRTLGDALKQFPNVQVAGRSVTYRGVSTLTGDTEMRFAVDGNLVGTYEQVETLVPLDQISRLSLLQPLEATQRYGLLGSAGVILIHTVQ